MVQILVIEDDLNVRTLILKLLKAENFDVIAANDGHSGIQLAQLHQPDLIICDIMMPECDGYEVLKHLRHDPATAVIPFIFLSAKADRSDLRQGMELGADDYLTKPFRRNELLGAITARLAKQAVQTQPYIDEMKRAVQTLGQLAYYDAITNLPNRVLFHQHCQEALKQANRTGQQVAVLQIHLRSVSAAGVQLDRSSDDRRWQAIAAQLKQAVGSDYAVARLANDDFGVLIHPLTDAQDAATVAQTILMSLVEPYNRSGEVMQLHTSIGIALYPGDGGSSESLLRCAETAMGYARTQGTNQYQFYVAEMAVQEAERLVLQSRLGVALDKLEFQLHYQPQVNLITGRITGVEALLRWQHPIRGLVYPATFLAIAEETGTIIPIGTWVLKTACTQAKAWQQTSHPPIRLSVNLSTSQFRHENLVPMVAEVLQETGFNPNLLVIELTEASLMQNTDATILTLQNLKQIGVQISIDDFGTGYSSINHLRRFPIDLLKIDQSFVQGVAVDPNDAAVTKAIIAMAQSLQFKVIAEGVETEEQYQFLRQSGCHGMQGCLFSPAVPAPDVEQLLSAGKRLTFSSTTRSGVNQTSEKVPHPDHPSLADCD